MDSTLTLSPPTSWVSAAISVVEVTTVSFLACALMGEASVQSSSADTATIVKPTKRMHFLMSLLERMGPMRAERKHHLHQEFIGIDITRVASETALSAQLAEFAWPVGQHRGRALIGPTGKLTPIGTIKASANKPAAAQLIIARVVEAECALFGRRVLALAPDELSSSHEGMINGATQRPPAKRSVD